MFGLPVNTVVTIWEKYCHDTCDFHPIHLLWLLSFLKLYLPLDAMHCIWNVSYPTFSSKIWYVVDYFFDCLEEVSLEFLSSVRPIDFGRFSARMATDCTECYVQRPHNPTEQTVYYSGYMGAHTVKYFTLVDIEYGILLAFGGPFPGPSHDAVITEESGILDKLAIVCK